MFLVIRKWFNHYFASEEAVSLLAIVSLIMLIVVFLGDVLLPVLAAMIIAFLLHGFVVRLSVFIPRNIAVYAVFILFVLTLLLTLVFAIPLLIGQMDNLIGEVPQIVLKVQQGLLLLQTHYPEYISDAQVTSWMQSIKTYVLSWGQTVLSTSLGSIVNALTVMVYGILIPMLVFFFLKDNALIFGWFTQFLPEHRPVMNSIWHDMHQQTSNYFRGKALEIAIVGVVSLLTFWFMGLNYGALLALAVGLSVIIPFIGAAVVTLPVALVGYFQWGISDAFFYLLLAYTIIQFLDGNILVPFLFSEAVNLHPSAVIIAVLFFGGIWGVWGVFFAIPLATVIKALVQAWPKSAVNTSAPEESVLPS